ncbi:CLC_0170 family protein [Paenibacillus humicola]|uniref:CLC_0170 family protein n=1 Tax=Paenibacillus humicola TaxID=3110540 RepID=UPI00237BB324|nr:CLC_0170 family protein [Paenibacillus humicola]
MGFVGGIVANVGYVLIMLLLSGIVTLFMEAKRYEKAEMKREHKVSRIIGWFNIALAIMLFLINWIYGKLTM